MTSMPLAPFPHTPGRNDLCPCGSGSKYKKCCARKDETSRHNLGKKAALESVLRRFFESHPRPAEQKNLSAWKSGLDARLQAAYGADKTDAIVGDTFFFGREVSIWNAFLQRETQEPANAAIAGALRGWTDPRFAVLRILTNAAAAEVGTGLETASPPDEAVQAAELLTGALFALRAGDPFRPQPGTIVLGFWIPGLERSEPLTALNSLVLIEEPEEESVRRLEKRFRESGAADVPRFYLDNFALVYETFGREAQPPSAEPLPQVVAEAVDRLEKCLVDRDVKHDRLMDVFFRFLKRKREKPDPGTAAAAAVLFGQRQGWLPVEWDFGRLAAKFGADPNEAGQLAQDMLAFEQRTSIYREAEERIGFRVGTDPEADEFRQWQLYMHVKDLDVPGEAALRRQMDYYARLPYSPASREEEAQLRVYEAYLAREAAFGAEKLAEALRLDPDNADALLLSAEAEPDAARREQLLERAEQSALRRYEPDVQPVWLHLPNRPYLRILLRRAVLDAEAGRAAAAFGRLYRLLRHNPADHQGARYAALSALLAQGDLDAASNLLGHYAEGSGDNGFYRWFEWAIAYRRDRFGAAAAQAYRTAVEANPYAEKYVRDRPAAQPYPRSTVVTPRSPEEARLIWTLLRPAL